MPVPYFFPAWPGFHQFAFRLVFRRVMQGEILLTEDNDDAILDGLDFCSRDEPSVVAAA